MDKEIQQKLTDDYYLQSLINAIKKVNNQFIKCGTCEYTQSTDTKYNEKIRLVERVFAYELYRRWQNALWGNEDELLVSGEIQKALIDDLCSGKKEKSLYYPDLVLHHSDFEDSRCNMIACEIKRACNYRNIQKDFDSIVEYTQENTRRVHTSHVFQPYHLGVFILYGMKDSSNEDDIPSFEKIKKFAKNVPEDLKSRIHCIIYDGEELSHKTVLELLNSQENS